MTTQLLFFSPDEDESRGKRMGRTLECCEIPLFQNRRFVRSFLATMSILAALTGWLVFIFEFVEFDAPTSAWLPGLVSTAGFIAINLVRFPDGNFQLFAADSSSTNGMSLGEAFFVIALVLTASPIMFSLFLASVDYKEEKEHTASISMFIQSILIFGGALGLASARSIDTTDTRNNVL